jgi:NosR/NirI family transcriptional regulator, nitrite reductase regulator
MDIAAAFLRFAVVVIAVCCGNGDGAKAQALLMPEEPISVTAPDAEMLSDLFPDTGTVRLERYDGDVPGWQVTGADGALVGHVASTWEIMGSVGYSGKPVDVLVAVSSGGVISGAVLVRHNEPILTLGLSDADIARFVSGFSGVDLSDPLVSLERGATAPDVIARATVSTGVIRDSILRTARTLALARGLVEGQGIIRTGIEEHSAESLLASGALARQRVSMTEAAGAFAGAKVPVQPGSGDFIDLWVAIADPPSIGQNLLGEQQYSRIVGALGTGEFALFVASRGLQGHRGTAWRRSGTFDRIALVQDGRRFALHASDFARIDKLALEDLPEFKERSLFNFGDPAFDPTAPFRVEVTATRPSATVGDPELVLTMGVDYALPDAFIQAPPAEPEPLWQQTWQRKRAQVIGVAIMLATLTVIMFLQEPFVKRPRLWRTVRLGFLTVTLFWLGWGINGQLSIVQVVAFLHSLLNGFHWETFLIEPVIFTLWSGVALGLLFLGRGVYCGWLCPFGALQELTNSLAQKFGVRQIAVPHALHERLWVIKYTLFVAILGLSFFSMKDALILAEAEPFKTAISLRMVRAWPFVAFVLILLFAGLFIERFYCRYLCPLGAALAIPAKLKVFDWLRRRPQCGRECRLCEQKCTVGAIDPLGRINVNECVLCLRCQVIFYDPNTCPILKRRARQPAAAE